MAVDELVRLIKLWMLLNIILKCRYTTLRSSWTLEWQIWMFSCNQCSGSTWKVEPFLLSLLLYFHLLNFLMLDISSLGISIFLSSNNIIPKAYSFPLYRKLLQEQAILVLLTGGLLVSLYCNAWSAFADEWIFKQPINYIHHFLVVNIIARAFFTASTLKLISATFTGILLYEMLYGYTPFRGKTRQKTFANILHKDLKFPASIPVSLLMQHC